MDEIGDILKQARLEKGYSLNDVQQITKIQKRYLVAIEEGDFDVLPGDFYTRAFIRQYADVVGVDSDELLNQHKSEVPNPQTEVETKTAPSSNKKPLNKKNDAGNNLLRSNLPKILVIILVLAIVIALYYAWVQNSANNESIIQESNEGNVQISSNEQVSQAGDSSETQASQESESEESEESETSEAPDSASVALENADGTNATYSLMIPTDQTVPLTVGAEGGDSWISIDQDGSNLFQGTLADGDESSHDIPSDATEVYITLGNAPASVLEVDGTAVELPEENSDSITQRLTFNVTNEAQE